MKPTITINFIAARAHELGAAATNQPENSVWVTARVGHTVMQAATANKLEGVAGDCGGCLTCATCHVIVSEEFAALLPPPDAEELAMLAFTASPRQTHSRLSCQIKVTAALDGLSLLLPPSQY